MAGEKKAEKQVARTARMTTRMVGPLSKTMAAITTMISPRMMSVLSRIRRRS